MNINQNFLDKIYNNYFSETESSWNKPELISVTSIGEIFNAYLDFAEKTTDFKDPIDLDEPSNRAINDQFFMFLAHNLVFIHKILQSHNISFETLLNEHIKFSKTQSLINSHPSFENLEGESL